MVPSASLNKSLVNQRSLPEDFSDAYLRETYSSKFTTYLRKAIADNFKLGVAFITICIHLMVKENYVTKRLIVA